MRYITYESVEHFKGSVVDANLDTDTLQKTYNTPDSVLIFGNKHSKMELHNYAFKFYAISPKDRFEEFDPLDAFFIEAKMNESGGFGFSSGTRHDHKLQDYNVVVYESEFYVVSRNGTRINKVESDEKFVENGFVFKIDDCTGALNIKNAFNSK